jgi:hypothetical protein
VLSLVTCVSAADAADAAGSGGFVDGTAPGNGVTAAASEAARAFVAGMLFAARAVEGAPVEVGWAATDSRAAPALKGCGRSLTITGSLASFVAGSRAATGATPWRRW